jgi:hypothetical protein
MMKKLIFALVLLLCIAGGGVWYAVTNATALITRFKPQIEAAATTAVGAPVSFGALETTIFPDTRVVVDTVAIGGEKGLSLRDLALHLNLWALLGKRLEITELTLTEPTLTFVKDANGISLEGLPKKDPSLTSAPTTPAAPTGAGKGGDAAQLPLEIKLESFLLKNATVIFRDTVAKSERRISALNIEAGLDLAGTIIKIPSLTGGALVDGKLKIAVTAKDLSFDQAHGVLTAPKLDADIAGIPLQLSATFNTRGGTGEAAIRSTGVDLSRLRNLGDLVPPAVTALGLSGGVVPNLKAAIAPGAVTTSGSVALKDIALKSSGFAITKLNGDLSLRSSATDQSAESKNLTLVLNGEPVTGAVSAGIKGPVMTLHNLAVKTFNGTIQSSGTLNSKTQALEGKLDLAGLDIQRLLAVVKPGGPGALSGKLTRFQTAVKGTVGPNLLTTLTGSGSLLVNDGKLAGNNIGGAVLKTATNLPFVSGSFYDALPPETKKALDAPETVISSLGSSFTLGGGAITTKDLALKSSLFDIAAQGRARFSGELDLGATITFEKGLSGALAGKVKEVRAVLDKDGRLAVPLTIKGAPPKLAVMPDFAKLLQGSVGKVIEQKAGDVLNNLLQKKKGGSGKGLGGVLGF